MSTAKRIGIAVVEHAGRYLVGTRPAGVPLAGDAEFPGGKCEPGEAPIDAAVRECLEETGLSVAAERVLQQCEFDYPHGHLDLHFVLCHPKQAAHAAVDHRGYRWVTPVELAHLRFPEANASVIRLLLESNPQ